MALTRSIGAYDDGTPLAPGIGTTPLDTRQSLSALWASAGVVTGGPSPLVTGTAGFAYSVAGPVPFVTTRGPSDGFQMFTNDGATSVTCPGAPGSGLQRIDILWVRHPTNAENSDTSSMPIFGVASGTAVSSSPGAPSIPTGALELARNTMTSAATSTASAGNTISQTAAVAVLRGSGNPTLQTASISAHGPWSNTVWAGLSSNVTITAARSGIARARAVLDVTVSGTAGQTDFATVVGGSQQTPQRHIWTNGRWGVEVPAVAFPVTAGQIVTLDVNGITYYAATSYGINAGQWELEIS